MKLRLILFAFLSFLVLCANAQDEQAKKILSDLSAKTKSYSTITATFSMTLIDQQSDLNIKKVGKGYLPSLDFNAVSTYQNQQIESSYNLDI